jgi:hypothetical protein
MTRAEEAGSGRAAAGAPHGPSMAGGGSSTRGSAGSSTAMSSAGDSDPGGRCGRRRGHGLRAGPGSGAGVLACLRCREGRRRSVLAGTADGPKTEDRKETRGKKERWWDP